MSPATRSFIRRNSSERNERSFDAVIGDASPQIADFPLADVSWNPPGKISSDAQLQIPHAEAAGNPAMLLDCQVLQSPFSQSDYHADPPPQSVFCFT
jgi:hypothetical protein